MIGVFSKKRYWFIPVALIGIIVGLMIISVYFPIKEEQKLVSGKGWEKTIRGWGCNIEECIQQTSDGGYVIAGLFYFEDGNIRREHAFGKAYLLKTDKEGNMIRDKVYGEKLLYNGEFRSVKQTSDGGYIAAGYINYGGSETSRIESDIFIVKTDENGNV